NFNPVKRPNPAHCLQHPSFQRFDILTLSGLRLNPLTNTNLKTHQDKSLLTNPMKISSGGTTDKQSEQRSPDNLKVTIRETKIVPHSAVSNKISKFKCDDIYNLK